MGKGQAGVRTHSTAETTRPKRKFSATARGKTVAGAKKRWAALTKVSGPEPAAAKKAAAKKVAWTAAGAMEILNERTRLEFVIQTLAGRAYGHSDLPPARSRLLVHRRALTRGKFIDRDKKRRPVAPVRFVRACRAGHIGDIDWYAFAHNGASDCAKQQRQLFIDERGTSGDLTEVWVRCECGKGERSMAQAALLQNRALGLCDGARPWLGPFTKEACGEPSRLLIRSASNEYFPQLMSVISLPERDEIVRRAVDAAWSFLEIVEDMERLQYEWRRATVKAAVEGITDEEVFAEIRARRGFGIKPTNR